MSKIIYACLRAGTADEAKTLERRIAAGANSISPRSSGVRPPYLYATGRILVGVTNPSTTVLTNGPNVCVGHVSGSARWQQVGGEMPEGTYAICRADAHTLELLADEAASRTLWYYMDDQVLLASTSQRWLVTVLGTFEPNDRAVPWMLSAGTLGPVDAWDRRFSRLQANSRLLLDRASWTTKLAEGDASFLTACRGPAEQLAMLRETLKQAFSDLEFDYSKWVLPLSGGYDSRAILCLLARREGLRAVTWGAEHALNEPGSDAVVAADLAREMSIQQEYLTTDAVPGSLAEVFDKFVRYGEGRTSNISAYLDGFAIWESLLERGVEGIIRGDEGFGWKPVRTNAEARWSVGLRLWSDYANLPTREGFELPQQDLPAFLQQRGKETPAQWRDRLYHQYRIPTLLAALTDLKVPFVEVANPFLTPSILRFVRTLPDDLRTNKALFRQIADEVSPKIPYADSKAIVDIVDVLASGEAREILLDTVRSGLAKSLFSSALLELESEKLSRGSQRSRSDRLISRRARRRLRYAVPAPVKRLLKRHGNPVRSELDYNELAFRTFIVCRMHEVLGEDSGIGHAIG